MGILAAVAIRAVLAQLLGRDHCGVAGVAGDPGVSPDQCKLVPARVVVVVHLPVTGVVAVLALGAEPCGMHVVSPMASRTILGNLVLVVAAAMAGQTVDVCMGAQQRKPGLLQVIERGTLPLRGHMTAPAIRAAAAAMHVIRGVAAIAGRWSGLVAAADVAGIATYGLMSARQCKVGRAVIELAAAPVPGAVTIGAGLRELSVMRIVRLVTAGTARDDAAPWRMRLVALLAGQSGMGVVQGKVSEPVIEMRRIELHDVGAAALVIGMAGAALPLSGVRHVAMEAMMPTDIRGDLLVTLEAQGRLGAHVGAVMAAGAGRLELRVRTGDRPGHQQGLHGH